MPETPSPKSRFENINDLIRAMIWPLVILIFFIAYHGEFTKIVTLIPSEIERSSKISIGSMTLEIEKTARSSGNGKLAVIIKNLSEKGIRKLLSMGSGSHSFMIRSKLFKNGTTENGFTLPIDTDVLKELEKKGLLQTNEPIDKFLSYFKGLHPNESTRYTSPDGLSSSDSNSGPDSTYTKNTDYSIPVSRLSSADSLRIEQFDGKLSQQGQKAFDIIVQVIAEQLKKD